MPFVPLLFFRLKISLPSLPPSFRREEKKRGFLCVRSQILHFDPLHRKGGGEHSSRQHHHSSPSSPPTAPFKKRIFSPSSKSLLPRHFARKSICLPNRLPLRLPFTLQFFCGLNGLLYHLNNAYNNFLLVCAQKTEHKAVKSAD